LVACPICQSTQINRIPSTFGIKSRVTPSKPVDLQKLNRKITQFVEQNFDNVGADFAKEALKIHYGATEPRNIRGVSTAAEEKTLKEEGVEFIKVPLPVSDSSADA
jgi:hypothetical protein